MRGRAEGAAENVKEKKAQMTERVLDVVAEHPEEGHVAEEMRPAAVNEGVGDERELPRQPLTGQRVAEDPVGAKGERQDRGGVRVAGAVHPLAKAVACRRAYQDPLAAPARPARDQAVAGDGRCVTFTCGSVTARNCTPCRWMDGVIRK